MTGGLWAVVTLLVPILFAVALIYVFVRKETQKISRPSRFPNAACATYVNSAMMRIVAGTLAPEGKLAAVQ